VSFGIWIVLSRSTCSISSDLVNWVGSGVYMGGRFKLGVSVVWELWFPSIRRC
jgi:hypothetical protein